MELAGRIAQMRPFAPRQAKRAVNQALDVRMALVPAVLALLGKAACWLSRRLDEIPPRIDIEGAKLDASPSTPNCQSHAGIPSTTTAG